MLQIIKKKSIQCFVLWSDLFYIEVKIVTYDFLNLNLTSVMDDASVFLSFTCYLKEEYTLAKKDEWFFFPIINASSSKPLDKGSNLIVALPETC